MPEFSQEGADIKRRFLKIFDDWESKFYDGASIRKTKENPKGGGITKGRAHRGLYSLLISPDDVHLDYVDNRMSKGASVKSMMGGLGGRVQKLTDGGQSKYAVSPTDSMHHANNHSSYGATARIQNQNLLRKWLQISADNGEIYGEGEGNLAGNSQDARAHVGHRGKAGTKFNPTLTHGKEGQTALSSHPRGTTDAGTAIEHKVYNSAEEMFESGAEVRNIHKKDLTVGNAADATRRASINKSLQAGGILLPGDDAFAATTPQTTRTAAKTWLTKNKQAMIDAAEAFDPELARKVAKDFNGGAYLSVDPLTPAIKQAYKLFKGNKVGAALGAIQDPKIVDQVEQGDFKGAGTTAIVNGGKGALVQQAAKGLVTAVPRLAPAAGVAGPALAGTGLFVEGRQGSFTDKAVNAVDKHVNSKLLTRNDPTTDIGKRTGEWLANEAQYWGKELLKIINN